MSIIRIIPSLLLKDKKLVKGKNFKKHFNAGVPETTIKSLSFQGADEILILNIEKKFIINSENNLNFLKNISANASIPLSYGGNINCLESATKIIKCGYEKIYIYSSILNNKNLPNELVSFLGGSSVIGGVNICSKNNDYYLLNSNREKNEVIKFINYLENQGIGELKVTFVDREGCGVGLDLNFCKFLLKETKLPCIFEGGIGNLDHIKQAIDVGVKAIGLGKIITFGDYNIFKIKSFLKNKGYPVRT